MYKKTQENWKNIATHTKGIHFNLVTGYVNH